MVSAALTQLIYKIAALAPEGTMYHFPFVVAGTLALILIGLICGGVGSLVVGNRMAFFSDALAHCAFAGVGLGILLGLVTGASVDELAPWILPIMVVFGVIVGLGIAFVRDQTSQANDTVIGVFFAGAIGLGAIFLKAGSQRKYFPPEDFLFGNLVDVKADNLAILLLLGLLTALVLIFLYNGLVFTSFSPSLARSRGISVRALSYLFIVLLALVVNLCLLTVGALLINALLIVPAATAANVCRNMRQLFATSILLCMLCGLVGQWLAWEVQVNTVLDPGESGTIVVLAVLLYFFSIPLGAFLRQRRTSQPAAAP